MSGATEATPPVDRPAEDPVDLGDNDTVYVVKLTGLQIDVIATLFDQIIRANGVVIALQLVPVLEAVMATRKLALQKTLKVPATPEPQKQ